MAHSCICMAEGDERSVFLFSLYVYVTFHWRGHNSKPIFQVLNAQGANNVETEKRHIHIAIVRFKSCFCRRGSEKAVCLQKQLSVSRCLYNMKRLEETGETQTAFLSLRSDSSCEKPVDNCTGNSEAGRRRPPIAFSHLILLHSLTLSLQTPQQPHPHALANSLLSGAN